MLNYLIMFMGTISWKSSKIWFSPWLRNERELRIFKILLLVWSAVKQSHPRSTRKNVYIMLKPTHILNRCYAFYWIKRLRQDTEIRKHKWCFAFIRLVILSKNIVSFVFQVKYNDSDIFVCITSEWNSLTE